MCDQSQAWSNVHEAAIHLAICPISLGLRPLLSYSILVLKTVCVGALDLDVVENKSSACVARSGMV